LLVTVRKPYEKGQKLGSTCWFGTAVDGHYASRSGSFPAERELLMPQPILRHIARRAVQVAIVAAGILVVLLVFSRQAHAATSPTAAPSAPAPSPAPSAPAPAPSAPAPSAPAPSAPAPSAP